MSHQVVEKALKGYLYANRQESKTHNLSSLVKICTKLDREFSDLHDKVDVMTDAYVGERYPDAGIFHRFQSKDLAEEFLQEAGETLKLIEKKFEEVGNNG